MTSEVKERWLSALRSGEFKKGRGRLVEHRKDGNRHCCLGVLRDVVGGPEGDRFENLRETARAVGLPSGAQTELIQRNDESKRYGRGWAAVIKYIEENL